MSGVGATRSEERGTVHAKWCSYRSPPGHPCSIAHRSTSMCPCGVANFKSHLGPRAPLRPRPLPHIQVPVHRGGRGGRGGGGGGEDDNDPTPSLLRSESESLLLSSPPPSLWKNFQSRRLNMTGNEGGDCEGRRRYFRCSRGGRGMGRLGGGGRVVVFEERRRRWSLFCLSVRI